MAPFCASVSFGDGGNLNADAEAAESDLADVFSFPIYVYIVFTE